MLKHVLLQDIIPVTIISPDKYSRLCFFNALMAERILPLDFRGTVSLVYQLHVSLVNN